MQFRLFVTLAVFLMSSGCTTLPQPKSFDDKGCGIHQFDDAWVARSVSRISWTGACKSGLMEGDGQLTVVNSSGKNIATYKGWMKEGRYNTLYAEGGKLIDKGVALLVDGDFRYEGKFTWGEINQGKQFAKGVLAYDGHFVKGKYMIGTLYLTNGGRLEGHFDSNAVSYGADGRGVIEAKYIQPNGSIGYWIVNQKIYKTEKESRAASLKRKSEEMMVLRHNAQIAKENYENVYKNALGSLGSIALIAADAYVAKNEGVSQSANGSTSAGDSGASSSARSSQRAPGNANHCMKFHDHPNGRSLTIENSCPFNIQTYSCHLDGRGSFDCISTMPIRPSYHDDSHLIILNTLYGACKGSCDPGGSFQIYDGVSPNCECKSSTGSGGTAR